VSCKKCCFFSQFGEEDKICRPCLQRAQRYSRPAPDDPSDQSMQEDPAVDNALPEQPNVNVQDQEVQVNMSQMIPLPGYTRAPVNTHVCIIAACNNTDLQRIHIDVRATVLQEKCFYIPRGNRVCEEHKVEDSLWQNIEFLTRRVHSEFAPSHLKDMMDMLRTRKVFLDFDRRSSINNSVFHFYIGFSKSQFEQILETCPSISQRHKNKAGRALATVLTKLHTGESNQRLSKIFNISRNTLEKTMRLVRQDLINEFVPQHLGYDHLTRQDVINRCLTIPNVLFGNPNVPPTERNAIIILDGTYIYLQKSSNYYFQRKSYSLHKYRHLLKPFLMVCPDGHIIDIYGLYEATKSDATILSEILNSINDPFHWFFHENDVLILDRGFRDCIENVESCGYRAYMPATRDDNEYQLTTKQANDSRKVTMCRWVVETVNGRLKNQFRQLRHQNFNIAASHLFQEIKIAAALLNAFGVPLIDHRLTQEIINRIPNSSNQNLLGEYVIANNLNRRRADFENMNAEVPGMDDFPILSADDLIIFSLGPYQVQQARSYYGEHVKSDGSYLIEVCREPNLDNFSTESLNWVDPWLLRGRIQSRHSSRRIYYVYILVERATQGLDAILGHYCSCIIGKRTLGCCSHVMSIIWYMGWGRYQDDLTPPAKFLDYIIRHDIENEIDEDD
jgi:hypothetical protein